jgi:alkylation response protein AidB-like acyl-CoA dehydrogenase
MIRLLTSDQKDKYTEFREFVKLNVEPFAAEWDKKEEIPRNTISLAAKSGYLGSSIPEEYGGKGWDFVTFGLLNEAVGRGTSALADLLTIQAMVSMTLLKWGTAEQRSCWLEPLAKGEIIGSFALTEPNVGSAIQNLETTFMQNGDEIMLNGHKKWISYGQVADLFLIFGKLEDKSLACLIPKSVPGLAVKPIKNMIGFKAARLAQIYFTDVVVPTKNIIGKPGFALSHIAPIGLHYGRISAACSALGLLRACFEESIAYASSRQISGKMVGNEGMIRSLIARMGTDLHAASLLCYSACKAEDEHLAEVFEKTSMAKYFSSRAAVKAASDAVQIRGASGCHESSSVARYYGDAKIMEIIEGTTQVHEQILGKAFVDKAPKLIKATRSK